MLSGDNVYPILIGLCWKYSKHNIKKGKTIDDIEEVKKQI